MIDLNNIKMNVIKTAEGGIFNQETIFRFMQDRSTVRAEYAGGKIGAQRFIHLIFSLITIN